MLDNKKHLLLRGILFLIVLCVGLYFGIRIGEGRYNFYKPQSPYYSRATLSAHNKGYDEGYSDGCKDKQAADYNSGWSAGYDFCLNENKTIRNDYDEGFSDGYDVGHDDGYIDGYNEGHDEAYDEGYDEGYNDGHNNALKW